MYYAKAYISADTKLIKQKQSKCTGNTWSIGGQQKLNFHSLPPQKKNQLKLF